MKLLYVHLALLLAMPSRPIASPIMRRAVGKAGLAWNNPAATNISQFITSEVGWYYTWSAWPLPNVSLDFVPMFWGVSQLADFQAQVNAQTIAERNIQSILGMNEPDQTGQSNLSAGDGATQWKTYLEPFKTSNPSVRLGSPATTNSPAGLQWMYDFFGACGGGCTVDFVALHWYGLGNVTDFIAHVTQVHNVFQRPIWVTEWACENFGDQSLGQCTPDQITAFLNATQSWMDATDFVERYAWLGVTSNVSGVNPDNNLLDSNGKLNALGKQYVGLNGSTTSTGGGSSSGGGVTFSEGRRDVASSAVLLATAALLVAWTTVLGVAI